MTRDEALALLMQMHDLALIKPFGTEEQNAVFQGIRLLGIGLEKPPCACKGRKVLAEEQSKVSGGWLLTCIQLDVNLGVDRDVDVLVFANEPREGE